MRIIQVPGERKQIESAFRCRVVMTIGTVILEEQLQPERLEAACAESGLSLELRRHDGYDHGYYFISTFIEEHLKFHAERLGA